MLSAGHTGISTTLTDVTARVETTKPASYLSLMTGTAA
jgi:hypothetical protein